MGWLLPALESYCHDEAMFLKFYTYLKRFFTAALYFNYLAAYLIIGLFRKRVLLLNYTALARHLGCRMTSASLIRLIQQKGGSVVFPFPLIYGKYKLNALPAASGIDLFAENYLKKNILFGFLVAICDVVVLNGEGNIYEYADWKNGIVPVELLLQAYIAKKKYNKKVLITNHSFDFIRNSGGSFREYIQLIYPQLDALIVRDRRSYDRLMELGISQVSLSADAAFLTSYSTDVRRRDHLMKKIGVRKEYAVIFLKTNVAEIPEVNLSGMIKLIKNTLNQEVILMPTTDSESIFLRNFRREAKVVDFNYSIRDLLDFLARASFVVSGRFHYCIFSVLARAPFLPFKSNTDKIEGLVDELGYPLRTMDFLRYNEPEMLANFNYLLKNRQSLRELLGGRIPYMQELASKNIPEAFP